ncbi:hypothetical protein CHS0354_023975 [Potamilus streckersoni]|uniref:PDZ domain-containing protein n=1 Tax=Potamilus streckersoni TaxID=2493646 RepID=A0AAE0RZF6_9BIVA|nr:hypothetical protein CHS0354_023975 [Potamilus streckersoni]
MGQTEYGIGAIPLGGYVSLAGMVDESMQADFEKVPPQPDEFRSKSWWKKVIILFAGVFMNAVLAIVILSAMRFSQGELRVLNGPLEIHHNSPFSDIGFETGDKVIEMNQKPIKYFDELLNFEELLSDKLNFRVQKFNGEEKTITVGEGFVSKFSDKISEMIRPLVLPKIGHVVVGSPAEKAGLHTGDLIKKIDEDSVRSWTELVSQISERKGREFKIEYERNGQVFTSKINGDTEGRIGVRVDENALEVQRRELGLIEGVGSGVRSTVELGWFQIIGIYKMITGKLDVGKNLGGPIKIAKYVGEAAEAGLGPFWHIVAMLSISLAILNILPIPALDGAHIVIVLIEAVIRKELSVEVKKEGKWGFIDTKGNLKIPNIYESVSDFTNGFAIVNTGLGYELINVRGETLYKWNSDKILIFEEGKAALDDQQKYGYINQEGRFVIELQYADAKPFSNGMAAVGIKSNDGGLLFGFIDSTGYMAVPPIFSQVKPFYRGVALVASFQDKKGELLWGLINKKGEYLVRPSFLQVRQFKSGLAGVSLKSKSDTETWGFIRTSGEFAIAHRFEWVGDFEGVVCPVKYKGKFYFLLKNDRLLTSKQFDQVGMFRDGFAKVLMNGKWGHIDKTGDFISSAEFDEVGDFRRNRARVRTQGTWGVIDEKGRFVVPDTVYNKVGDFYNSRALVNKNGFYGYIDRYGVEVTPRDFLNATDFVDGKAIVETKQGWNVIDTTGRFLCEKYYDFIEPFENGYARVWLKHWAMGKVGFININGDFVIPPQYDETGSFYDGAARVKVDKKWGYIDKSGLPLTKAKYDVARDFKEEAAAVLISNNWKFINKDGVEFPENLELNYVRDFSEGYAAVKFGSNWGYIDKLGAVAISPIYKDALDFSNGRALVRKQNGKLILIDKGGREKELDSAFLFVHPLFSVGTSFFLSKTGYYGLVDTSGYIIHPPTFEAVQPLRDGYAAVSVGGVWAIVNYRGEEVVEYKYNWIQSIEGDEEYWIMKDKLKWGYMSKFGGTAIAPSYYSAYPFSEGFASVVTVEKGLEQYRYINKNGSFISNEWYVEGRKFSSGRAAVRTKSKSNFYGFIGTSGSILIDSQFEEVRDFSEGLAAVRLIKDWRRTKLGIAFAQNLYPLKVGDVWGYIDETGDIKIVPVYDSAGYFDKNNLAAVKIGGIRTHISKSGNIFSMNLAPGDIYGRYEFSEGLAAMYYEGKKGFINEKGLPVIKSLYQDVGKFSEGLAWVSSKESEYSQKVGYIDATGKMVIPQKYLSATDFKNGRAIVREKKGYVTFTGVIDKSGKIIIPVDFPAIREFHNGVAAFRKYDRENALWGFMDENGKQIIEPEFLSVGDFKTKVTYARKRDELFVIIDKKGNKVMKEKFQYVSNFENGYAKVLSLDGEWAYIDSLGQYLSSIYFELVGEISENIYAGQKLGNWGYLNNQGEMLTEFEFKDARPFKQGRARVSANGTKYGYINKKGKSVIGFLFDQATDFTEGFAQVMSEGKWYHIDTNGVKLYAEGYDYVENFVGELAPIWNGREVEGKYGSIYIGKQKVTSIPFEYDELKDFTEGICPARKGNKWGYINQNNEWVIQPTFEDVTQFASGYASAKYGGFWGVIDKSGRVVVRHLFSEVLPFYEGRFVVRTGTTWGIVDKNGTLIAETKYNRILPYSSEVAAFFREKLWGFLDLSGKEILSPTFELLYPLNQSIALAGNGSFFGYVDKTGATKIPFDYELATEFSENLAAVSINGKWGFINARGAFLRKPTFTWAKNFSEGIAPVMSDKRKWGYVNRNGDMQIPFQFRQAESFSDGFAAVLTEGGLWGYIDKSGALKIPARFLTAYNFTDGIAKVEAEIGKFGLIDKSGNFILKQQSLKCFRMFLITS